MLTGSCRTPVNWRWTKQFFGSVLSIKSEQASIRMLEQYPSSEDGKSSSLIYLVVALFAYYCRM
ncbi:hypothetical protein SLEP1_g25649 [Rubroshorea leprosula]|uniref:Uncharacterized protein n=1 Tax=Rubroshorea leprosula TaxID=152421 RepID=A0AAV5JU68_9ROSI|nr:hypothetical protein SLEP1_g25649 [Rubroshorea leprosula]